MKKCRWCGYQNKPDAKFCTACGRKFDHNRRLYIILGSVVICLAVIAVLTFTVLWKSNKKREVKEQAQKVITEFTFGEIYEINDYLFAGKLENGILPEDDGEASGLRESIDHVLEKYFLYVTIELGKIDENTVTYSVTAPDMSGFFQDCMEHQENYRNEGIADYFQQSLEKAALAEKDVTLEYTYEDSVFKADYTSEEFTDAVMGGLVQGYRASVDKYGRDAVTRMISGKETAAEGETAQKDETAAESGSAAGTEAQAAAGTEIKADASESTAEPETGGAESAPGEQAAEQPAGTAIDPAYAEIIEKYKTGISQGWGMQEYAAAGLCYLFGYYSDTSQPGYTLLDVNNDGVEELLIGEANLPSGYKGMFYEMYTINEGQITLVASSQERNRYYLCTGNEIGNEGSGGAFNSNYAYYRLEGGVLSLIEAVIFDGMYDQDSPWFYSITGFTEDCYTPITEGEADRIRQSHEYADIAYTPLSEFGNQ